MTLDQAAISTERHARMAWSLTTEPGEIYAVELVSERGAVDSWRWMCEQGARIEAGLKHEAGQKYRGSVKRWYRRAQAVDFDAARTTADQVHATVLIPGDEAWPDRLDDLGNERPLCLWVRGDVNLARLSLRAVSLVGARAATYYGTGRAGDIAADLAAHGATVVSGGAFGIDGAAHRGALAAQGATIAFLAGGVDKLYPSGNAAMLTAISERGGAVVSELGPGMAPLRSRFLKRNRLIAALGNATVVVEAGLRSGAMSTARQATTLLRPLAAVPGPVTSGVSAGCHELIRSGMAVLVANAEHVLELIGPVSITDSRGTETAYFSGGSIAAVPFDLLPEWLQDAMRIVITALAQGGTAMTLDQLVAASGLASNTVLSAVGELEGRGDVKWQRGGWRIQEEYYQLQS